MGTLTEFAAGNGCAAGVLHVHVINFIDLADPENLRKHLRIERDPG